MKLTDFTTSREFEEGGKLFETEGTPAFTAPECAVPGGGYEPKPTDIWSFGVCLYTYVAGIVPFYGEGELEMQIKAQKDELKFPPTFSPDLCELLSHLLEKDPKKRWTIKDLVAHKWLMGEEESEHS